MPKAVLGMVLAAVAGCQCDRSQLQSDKGAIKAATGIDFGKEQLGQVKSLTGQVVLTNTGTGPVSILTTQIDGPNASDFSLGTNAPSSLAAGSTLTATLQFAPADAGSRQAALSFTTDVGNASVPLTGEGVLVELCPQPASLDFGNVQVNGLVATLAAQIVNCGKSPADLQFGASGIAGPNASDFGVTGTTNQTLAPGASVSLSVSFAPAQTGPRAANLPFYPCAGCTSQQINLAGVGIDGALVFTPNPVTFGNVPVGQAFTSVVTGTNSGTAGIQVQSLAIQNGDPAFTVDAGMATPIALAPGQSFQAVVRYAPTGSQGDKDTLVGVFTVADGSVPARTGTDPLDGNAPQVPCTLVVTPASVSFGYVAVNQLATRQVSFQNQGTGTCHVAQLALSSTTDAYFALPAAAPLAIGAGMSSTVAVTFRPTSATAPFIRRGALDFSSDDPAKPTGTVPLIANIQNTAYAAGPWPKWHRDNGNTGLSQADTSATGPNVQWKVSIGPPATYHGKGTYLHSPALGADDTVFQLGGDGGFIAVNHANGAVVWRTAVTAPEAEAQESTPTVVGDGGIYLMTGGEQSALPQFYELSSSGAVMWSKKNSDDGYDSCPGLGYDGTLYESDDDSKSVVAFKNNVISWTGALGCASKDYNCWIETFAGAIAPDGTSYWSGGGDAMALSPTGTALWTPVSLVGTAQPAGKNKAAPAFDGTNLYVTATTSTAGSTVTGYLFNLNPTNGQTVWKFATAAVPSSASSLDYGMSSPALGVDGTVVIGFPDGVYGITPAGTQSWKVPVSAGVLSSAAVGGDNTAFIGTQDGRLLAISVSSGTLKWSFQAGGPVNSSPAIGSDGTVYFSADDGFLYALR